MILKKKTQNLSFFDFYKHEKNQYDSSHEPTERVQVAQYAFLKVRKFLIRNSLMQIVWLWDPTLLQEEFQFAVIKT